MFKIGDKIRITGDSVDNYDFFELGEIGEVVAVIDKTVDYHMNSDMYVKFGNDELFQKWYVMFCDAELVDE